MRKRILVSLMICSLTMIAAIGCGSKGGGGDTTGGSGGGTTPLSAAKAITAFSFTSPAATGTIGESAKTIAVTVPNGTNVTALAATFTTTGESVKVGSTIQVSGTTPNDFTNPVAYTVTAADGSSAQYTVTVTVALISSKTLTSFTILGIPATINESSKTIALSVPYGTDVTGLTATYTTTGASVKVGGTVQVSGTTTNDFTSPVVYTVTAADGSTTQYTVTVTMALNSAKTLTSFTILGIPGTINGSSKTISLSVPYGTNVTALIATFSTTGASVKVDGTVQVSGTTTNDFTSPVVYTVTAADGSTIQYTVTVTVSAAPKAITAFSFTSPAATGIVNEGPKIISITVPYGTNVTALVANFTSTGTSVKVVLSLQISGLTPNDFTSPVTYTVTAVDGSTATYTVTVTVAENTRVHLPKTGQTACYSVTGSTIACSGTGQDGDLQKGVAWPSPRFTNADGTTPITENVILDRLTGLIWTKDAGIVLGPAICGSTVTKTWQAALDYVACLNLNNYFGYSDWRLPNVRELWSLVNFGQNNQMSWLNSQGFSNVQNDVYWSSTTTPAWGTNYANCVDYAGEVISQAKDQTPHFVWPVLTGPSGTISLPKTGQIVSYASRDDGDLQKGVSWPNPRFTNADGSTPINSDVIVDQLTGLMWTKDADAPGPSACYPGASKIWLGTLGALDYVTCLNANNYLGYTDWRLPNVLEFESMYNSGQADSASWLTTQGFTNFNIWSVSGSYWWWTSTTTQSYPVSAYAINITYGMVGYGASKSDYTTMFAVWPVRGGL